MGGEFVYLIGGGRGLVLLTQLDFDAKDTIWNFLQKMIIK